MTRDQWDRLERLHFTQARRQYPTTDLLELRKSVRVAIIASYGPRPPKPKKPGQLPWWARLALKAVPGKEKYAMKVENWMRAAVFGLVGAGAVLQAAVGDNTISLQEWVAIGGAFMTAFWGKLSNPAKAVSTKPDEG